jgi:hypothetical protein
VKDKAIIDVPNLNIDSVTMTSSPPPQINLTDIENSFTFDKRDFFVVSSECMGRTSLSNVVF